MLEHGKAGLAGRQDPGRRTPEVENITVLAYDSLHPELKDRFVVSRANSGEFGVRFFEYEAAQTSTMFAGAHARRGSNFFVWISEWGRDSLTPISIAENAQFVVSARVRKIALPNLRAVRQYPNSGPPVPKAGRAVFLVAGGLRRRADDAAPGTASSCSQAGGISCSRGPAAAPVDPPAAPVDFRPGPGGRRRQRKTCKPQWLPR